MPFFLLLKYLFLFLQKALNYLISSKMGCCCIQNLQNVDDVDQKLSDSKVFLNKNKQALILKEQGNEYFKKRSYQNAINCYSQAIIKNPYELVYYTNLAQAFRANAQYQQSIETVNKMLKINFPVSANYSDLLSKGKITKARCLTSIVKKYIISNIYKTAQNEKMKHKCQQATQIFEQIKKLSTIDIKEYLNNCLKIKNYIQKIQKNTSQIQVVNYLKIKIKQSKKGLHKQNNWKKIQKYFQDQNELLKQIQSYYAQCHRKFIQQADQDEEYLIDPITYVIDFVYKGKIRIARNSSLWNILLGSNPKIVLYQKLVQRSDHKIKVSNRLKSCSAQLQYPELYFINGKISLGKKIRYLIACLLKQYQLIAMKSIILEKYQ